jgi:hypothetical protein
MGWPSQGPEAVPFHEVSGKESRMKVFRIVGLLGILAAVWSGMTGPLWATITCYENCGGVPYYGTCYMSLQDCCNALPGLCPDGYEYLGGSCTDGHSYC